MKMKMTKLKLLLLNGPVTLRQTLLRLRIISTLFFLNSWLWSGLQM